MLDNVHELLALLSSRSATSLWCTWPMRLLREFTLVLSAWTILHFYEHGYKDSGDFVKVQRVTKSNLFDARCRDQSGGQGGAEEGQRRR